MKDNHVMYNNKLVVAIKSNGNVLRERDNSVFLPFGEEYTILIKNFNSLPVYVELDIDGTDATFGTKLKIDPNREIEVKRFIKSANLSTGNAFKFIKRTEQIEQHRGINIQDGLIVVRFQFEMPPINIAPGPITAGWNGNLLPARGLYPSQHGGAPFFGSIADQSTDHTMISNSMSLVSHQSTAACNSEPGITVPGSLVNQQFTYVAQKPLQSEKFVMVIKIIGEDAQGSEIVKPVLVNDKIVCVTCGTVCKTNMNFCSMCGTSLNIR